MTITTYVQLQAAVADWLHRTDLTSQVADFITLAEDEINTELRLRIMESDESLTLTAGTRAIALPARFIEPIKLDLVFSGRDNETLDYLTPQQMGVQASSGSAYQPEYFTINGSNIEFPSLSDQNYTVRFRMLKGFDIASTSTNELLSNYRGLYLYGALLQAAPYMVKDDRIPTWRSMYESLKTKVNRKEGRTRALTRLLTDFPTRSTHSNIFRG